MLDFHNIITSLYETYPLCLLLYVRAARCSSSVGESGYDDNMLMQPDLTCDIGYLPQNIELRLLLSRKCCLSYSLREVIANHPPADTKERENLFIHTYYTLLF